MSDVDLVSAAPPKADPFRDLGVRWGEAGPTLRVWSGAASSIDLVIDDAPTERVVPLTRDASGVWTGSDPRLTPGRRYWLRADGDRVSDAGVVTPFDPAVNLLDPYARGLARTGRGEWRSIVVDESFDWGGVEKPAVPLDHTVVYEAHVRGLTRLNPAVPDDLRGTYAGLAHESTIAHLTALGVTAVQLLPVHHHVDEQRLVEQGFENYWGYNTLSYFAPHPAYASREAQLGGPSAILREFKGMVRLLHAAGIEVWLDVVYNHTAEEGEGGPVTSFRGLDGAYYRHNQAGHPIDVTGCGNTFDTSLPAGARLVLDSLRYWANECQIDGFRFDLAATLGRGTDAVFSSEEPLLRAIRDDEALAGVKLIAEPWDVGLGGWQTGNFPDGWSEWNDRFRNRARDFWLRDIADARGGGVAANGLGSFASKISGSSNIYAHDRGPLAGVNLITAHDGFTLADLVSYDAKHNLRNGEDNRDGTDDNRSFNHGAEGPTDNPWIIDARRRASRNLLATLFLSAGIPMLTAGDEIGRTQRGNNNGYCSDDETSWVDWILDDEKAALLADTRALIRHRRENPALRPVRFGTMGQVTLSATDMTWFDAAGAEVAGDAWNDPHRRTLQYLAASTPELEEFNRVLVSIHGSESSVAVTLPEHRGVRSYEALWTSGDTFDPTPRKPGDLYDVVGPTVTLWKVS
ncbi:glycogen debranching protein GlgX [Frondihabitans australicus]|uniref:Glycogen operon protein n=1 Tax=Frondihabitans australicus TaxID=386892 RepID=A0A495ICH8_9MICO|nr:glycogen debranching protein GlgX [Frondihabitans australicus]RKR73714.1 glycogen operon protein [Frondihabitans australicus]